MKKTILFSFLIFMFLMGANEVKAACTGSTVQCRSQETCAYFPAGCTPQTPGCNFQCNCDAGTTWTCNSCSGLSDSNCSASGACSGVFGCLCISSGSCSVAPVPTSGPTPTPGGPTPTPISGGGGGGPHHFCSWNFADGYNVDSFYSLPSVVFDATIGNNNDYDANVWLRGSVIRNSTTVIANDIDAYCPKNGSYNQPRTCIMDATQIASLSQPGDVLNISANIEDFGGTIVDCEKSYVMPERPPLGFLDAANCSSFIGWAGDRDNPNAAVDVHFYVDGPSSYGTFIGSTTANITREPGVCNFLNGSNCGVCDSANPSYDPNAPQCKHGFNFSTPLEVKSGNDRGIYAYAINLPGTPGFNSLLFSDPSPKIVNCVAGSCSVAISGSYPNPLQIFANTRFSPLIADGSATGGTMTQVTFDIADSSVATVCPVGSATCNLDNFSDAVVAYQTDILGLNPGFSTVLNVSGTMEAGSIACTPASIGVQVVNPPAWWQVIGGDVITSGGSITSQVPTASCVGCSLIKDNINGFPGVAIASGTVTAPSVSSKEWKAPSSFPSEIAYDYEYFRNKLPFDPDLITTSSINNISPLVTGLTKDGYIWSEYNNPGGTLTIDKDLNLGVGNKIVLFANSNVVINGTIDFPDNNGFFMLIASGNITINQSVGDDVQDPDNPDLKGIFFADGVFSTDESGNAITDPDPYPLHIKGVVVADSFVLGRGLENNSLIPGELFEYAPDQVFNIPKYFSSKKIQWREVAP